MEQPSIIDAAIKRMTKSQPRALLALPSEPGIWATASEMKHRTTAASLDILYAYHLGDNLCERRWTRWGAERGQKRGEGYEYSITPLGMAVRDVLFHPIERTAP